MSETYPTLSVNPDAAGFQQGAAADPTIRNDFENGKVLTRAKFTSVPQKWSFNYSQLSNTDKELIQAFERTTVRYGADSFICYIRRPFLIGSFSCKITTK